MNFTGVFQNDWNGWLKKRQTSARKWMDMYIICNFTVIILSISYITGIQIFLPYLCPGWRPVILALWMNMVRCKNPPSENFVTVPLALCCQPDLPYNTVDPFVPVRVTQVTHISVGSSATQTNKQNKKQQTSKQKLRIHTRKIQLFSYWRDVILCLPLLRSKFNHRYSQCQEICTYSFSAFTYWICYNFQHFNVAFIDTLDMQRYKQYVKRFQPANFLQKFFDNFKAGAIGYSNIGVRVWASLLYEYGQSC